MAGHAESVPACLPAFRFALTSKPNPVDSTISLRPCPFCAHDKSELAVIGDDGLRSVVVGRSESDLIVSRN